MSLSSVPENLSRSREKLEGNPKNVGGPSRSCRHVAEMSGSCRQVRRDVRKLSPGRVKIVGVVARFAGGRRQDRPEPRKCRPDPRKSSRDPEIWPGPPKLTPKLTPKPTRNRPETDPVSTRILLGNPEVASFDPRTGYTPGTPNFVKFQVSDPRICVFSTLFSH